MKAKKDPRQTLKDKLILDLVSEERQKLLTQKTQQRNKKINTIINQAIENLNELDSED
jgi:hypothetical protein